MPKIYGIEHIVYLLLTALVFAVTLHPVVKHPPAAETRRRAVRILGAALLALIIWNRLSVTVMRDALDANGVFSLTLFWRSILPSTICGTTSLLLALAALICREDSRAFHFLAPTMFTGGLATLLYPDFIGQAPSIFYPMTISGLLHHTVGLYLVLYMYLTRYIKPALKRWWCLPAGLACYYAYGLFYIHVIGSEDAMQIRTSLLEGLPLRFAELFVLGTVLYTLWLRLWEGFVKKHSLQQGPGMPHRL